MNGYIGVNNVAKKIKSLYVGTEGYLPVYGSYTTQTISSATIKNNIFTQRDASKAWTFSTNKFTCKTTNGGVTQLTAKVDISNLSFTYRFSGTYDSDAYLSILCNNEYVINDLHIDETTQSGSISNLKLKIGENILFKLSQNDTNSYYVYIENINVVYREQTSTEYRTDIIKKVKSSYIGINDIAKQWYGNDNKEYPSPPSGVDSNETTIATFNSLSDVDDFFNTYTYKNGWSGLKLRQIIEFVTGDESFSGWSIVGFNQEHNQTAADGTVYDNGYGICLIPRNRVCYYDYDKGYGGIEVQSHYDKFGSLLGGYISSDMYNYINTKVAQSYYHILGNHLIKRNVLLSSNIDSSQKSSAYTWTTAYFTNLSVGQCFGNFNGYTNKYDDGEASYQFSLFKKSTSYVERGQHFYFRNIAGNGNVYYRNYGRFIPETTSVNSSTGYGYYTFPMMYIR